MSLKACWILAAAIVLRFILNRAPKRILCLFWALAGIRLVLPVSIPSSMSLVPAVQPLPTVSEAAMGTPAPAVWESIASAVDSTVAAVERSSVSGNDAVLVFSIIWLAGIVLALVWAGIRSIRLKRSVAASIEVDVPGYGNRIKVCDDLNTSFIFGLLRPTIYMPSGLDATTTDYVLRHEAIHLRQKDHIVKPLAYSIAVIHWFNPLVWIAYALFNRDLEMACDEKAISDMPKDGVAGYTRALLDCSSGKRRVRLVPPAFGENNVKARIVNVLKYRKPKTITLVSLFALIVALGVFFMTDSAAAEKQGGEPHYGKVLRVDEETGVVVADGPLAPEDEPNELAPIPEPPELSREGYDYTYKETGSWDAEVIMAGAMEDGFYHMAANPGNDVYALCDGIVLYADFLSAYGRCVAIKDTEGNIWRYGHCSDFCVETGDEVRCGDVIAHAGSSGNTPNYAIIISFNDSRYSEGKYLPKDK